jgi:hypothetical protein
MKIIDNVHTIVPMVAVDTEFSPPRNTLAERLVNDLKGQTSQEILINIPGGFFVALDFLIPRIEEFANYLYFHYENYKDLEIGGGFNVFTKEGKSLGLPIGSTFSQSMQIVDNIVELVRHNDQRHLYISSQDYWDVQKVDESHISIKVGKISKRDLGQYLFPIDELVANLYLARDQVIRFAHELEVYLLMHPIMDIKISLIRAVFGIE